MGYDPLSYVKGKYIDPIINSIQKANYSGTQQAKNDVSSVKTVVSSTLSAGAGYAVSRVTSSTPQAAVATAITAAAGAAVTAGVGYVDGFGKSLGWWGQ